MNNIRIETVPNSVSYCQFQLRDFIRIATTKGTKTTYYNLQFLAQLIYLKLIEFSYLLKFLFLIILINESMM